MTAAPFQPFPSGYRLIDGGKLNALATGSMSQSPAIVGGSIDGVAIGGSDPAAGSFTNITGDGYRYQAPQLLAAAGSNSQANAGAITSSLVIVTTVSATTRGVRLPTAATGLMVQIMNDAATTVKVYPATNGSIGAASTNGNTTIATRKGTTFVARNTTHWIAQAGA